MKIKTQYEWIMQELERNKEVSRNVALSRGITRLAAYMADIRELGWEMIGRYYKTMKGRDYIYTVIKFPKKS